uniref:prolyl 4-hydroxylase subunit alpha-1-like n=1 Tax=Ciona intestinalis TaxID=7719 RepID=UPI000180B845|nr:prolyl 4-hydroxylase subunit alpha-1-like [Ciona intestinalis]|eukprot:XP_009860947.3 prolyl 4-hydroxylase subunit alpha-1-like [Ciona intestinalis]
MKLDSIICGVCCFTLLINLTSCFDWASSVAQLKAVAKTEQVLVSRLQNFINNKTEELGRIQNYVDALRKVSDKISSSKEEYISHPINQYHLIQRFAKEWTKVGDLLQMFNETGFELTQNISRMRKLYPTDNDLNPAAAGIERLQRVYELSIDELIEGNVKGEKSGYKLSPGDCFLIGKISCKSFKCDACKIWMQRALKLKADETFTNDEALAYEAVCRAKRGNLTHAFAITEDLLTRDPFNDILLGNMLYYRMFLRYPHLFIFHKDENAEDEIKQYNQICQGKFKLPHKVSKNLRCYLYTNKNDPRLRIKPVKVEELCNSPHIVQFYDVINNDDIETIKKMSKKHLSRALVTGPNNTGIVEDIRTSKVAWFKKNDFTAVKKLYTRISEMTGLSEETFEDLQVANYGLAGEYQPHFDYTEDPSIYKREDGAEVGNRIATMLLYLNDVKEGGRTAFIEPKIVAKPIKGSAVFWYNLYPSGLGDPRTRHASCPVVIGNKWASNVWVHEVQQEFKRKCGLRQDADNRIF